MKYRKVACAFWVDEKVRTFDDDGKLAFLYVLTHPAMTSVGAMRGTLAGLAAELSWSPRRIARALAPAIERGMLEVNADASYIGLPNFLRHNAPESPNVCKAWVSAITGIPECPEREAVIRRCRDYLAGDEAFAKAFEEAFAKAFGKVLVEAFTEASRKSMPNPEPEPEQEPEQEQRTGTGESLSPLPPSTLGLPSRKNGRRSRKHVNADWERR